MKICPRGGGGLSTWISKIAGTTTAFQQFSLKIGNSRRPPPKHVFDNKSAGGTPITMISVLISMFLRSRNPIDHYVKRLTIHVNGEILIK